MTPLTIPQRMQELATKLPHLTPSDLVTIKEWLTKDRTDLTLWKVESKQELKAA